jgi:hypothetical protein
MSYVTLGMLFLIAVYVADYVAKTPLLRRVAGALFSRWMH